MKPEQLLDPETLPDDLRWLATEFRLGPRDPVFLLIAWHWHRVQQAEDSLRAANVELQASVDARLEKLSSAVSGAERVVEAIAGLRQTLDARPSMVSAQIEEEMRAPLEKIRQLEKSLAATLAKAGNVNDQSRRREILAALLTGAALGIVGAAILLLA